MRSATVPVLLVALVAPGLASCTAERGGSGGSAAVTSEPRGGTAVSDAPRPTATDVVLSYAGWEDAVRAVEAAGYVSPVVEDGGTCTLELTSDGRTTSTTVAAVADATTTVCPGLSVPGDDLAPGTWTARLEYSSPTTEGTSEPLDVEVPA